LELKIPAPCDDTSIRLEHAKTFLSQELLANGIAEDDLLPPVEGHKRMQ
jgi:hypothetical protein